MALAAPGESRKLTYLLCGLGNKKYASYRYSKTEMLTYQSKANLDETILLGKITHYLDKNVRKRTQSSILGP